MDSLLEDWLVSRSVGHALTVQARLALLIEFADECPQAPTTLRRVLAGLVPQRIQTGWRPSPWRSGSGTVRQARDQLVGLLAGAGMSRCDMTALRTDDLMLVGRVWRAGAMSLEATADPVTCPCCVLARWVSVLDGYVVAHSPDDAELALRQVDTPGQHACQGAGALREWDRVTRPLLVAIDRRGYLSDQPLSTRSVTAAIAQARSTDRARTAAATVRDLPLGVRRIPGDLTVWLDRLEQAVADALGRSQAVLAGE